MGRVRVGISGWRYAGWRGRFYPPGLTQARELEYAAERFESIELNGSFYSLQRPEYYRSWCEQTPPGFVFAVKAGRFITHMKKLKDVDVPLANFFASGVLALEEKLGPILWQFPPGFGYDEARFERFFDLLPLDTEAAANLAAKHDARLEGRALTTTSRKRRLRHAFEVRHTTFMVPRFIDALRRRGFGLVIAETAGKFPYAEDITTDLVYMRLHGSETLYQSGYRPEELDRWAKRIGCWRAGREPRDAVRVAPRDPSLTGVEKDVWCFFDNTDVKLRAPYDAIGLIERLSKIRAG